MTVARSGHVAVLLQNGTVLIAGGVDTPTNGTSIASAEIFNPANNSFTQIPPMTASRRYITTSGEAILRNDGSVLIAGGINSGQSILDTADLYTGTFTQKGTMSNQRFLHAAALLTTGDVLITGGNSSSGTVSSADLFTAGESFIPTTGSMTTARASHTATRLPDDRVLIAGGNNGGGFLATAELYNPTAKTFSSTTSMAAARRAHIAVLLGTGDVLVAGGEDATTGLTSAELYGTPPIIVTIDVLPGNPTNTINLSAAGVIPVAIFSSNTPAFDAPVEVDPETLTLSGAKVRVAGRSDKFLCRTQDVNRDGLQDLVCDFENELNAQVGTTTAVLEGNTYSGVPIRGQDTINIVPDR
jgi:hypothetical protein